jgi:HD-GYP domain-containing protein (c-di-GMP phosphodiesterase class II)
VLSSLKPGHPQAENTGVSPAPKRPNVRFPIPDLHLIGGEKPEAVGVSEVLGALSFALDLTEGQPFGHALRSCLIGMGIAERLDLPLQERRDLYYAHLLKDVGCSSNAARLYELFGGDDRMAKRDLKRVDWSRYFEAAHYAVAHAGRGGSWFERARRVALLAGSGSKAARELVEARCRRGAQIVQDLGFGTPVSDAVMALDEHWNGRGEPRGLKGAEIPILARIMGLAQTIEVFAVLESPATALEVARSRRGTWFDPLLVEAAAALEPEITAWCALDDLGLQEAVRQMEPGDAVLLAGPGTLDRIAAAFAAVVDAKSPFTADHSRRVTELVVQVADTLGLEAEERVDLRRAALLHDLGKLSVPNSVLDKPGPLSAQEWETIRLHPYYTQRILDRLRGFQSLAFVASSHHERLDGRGYYRGLRGAQVPVGARILAVADIYDALTSARPYRPAMFPEVAVATLEKERGIGVAGDCLEALIKVVEDRDERRGAA